MQSENWRQLGQFTGKAKLVPPLSPAWVANWASADWRTRSLMGEGSSRPWPSAIPCSILVMQTIIFEDTNTQIHEYKYWYKYKKSNGRPRPSAIPCLLLQISPASNISGHKWNGSRAIGPGTLCLKDLKSPAFRSLEPVDLMSRDLRS